jgi:predicted phage-related endonuclease
MRYTIIDCEQRSPEWIAARIGRLTGSVASDMMAKIKSGEAAGRRNLRVRLALESITGKSLEDQFVSADMQIGMEREAQSLAIYEANTGQLIERTGFLRSEMIMAGCSLDGFVSNRKGIVEAKNPKAATHLAYLRSGEIPSDYAWQCTHNLWVSGADYCDFISYQPDFPEDLQYLCVRLERDARAIDAYDTAARTFLAEVKVEIDQIHELQLARAA